MPSFDFDQLARTEVDQGGNNHPPAPGMFEVVCTAAEAFTSKGGDDFVKFDMRVVKGEHADYEWTEMRSPGRAGDTAEKRENSYKALKGLCQSLGVDMQGVTSVSMLNERVGQVAGRWFSAEVRENGQYLNTWYTQLSEPASDIPQDTSGFQTQPSGGGATSGDRIPFRAPVIPSAADVKGTRRTPTTFEVA